MGYYNSYGSYGRNRGYSRSGWSNGGSRYSSNRGSVRKRSGCRVIERDGAVFVSAWRKNRKGFYTLYARPYKKTKAVQSDKGLTWLNLFVTIVNRDTMTETKCSGLYNPESQRLYIKEYNLIASARGGVGGYFGKHLGNRKTR